jgi:hypothetical protein
MHFKANWKDCSKAICDCLKIKIIKTPTKIIMGSKRMKSKETNKQQIF